MEDPRDLYDSDVYDHMPEGADPNDYDEGVCSICYVGLDTKHSSYNVLLTYMMISNAYAFILTNYEAPVDSDKPFVVAYVIHKLPIQQEVFLYKSRSETFKMFVDARPFHDHVFFHKGWYTPFYKKDKLNTPGKAYIRCIETDTPMEERKRLRMHFMKLQGCYEPISEKDPTCTTWNRPETPSVCTTCNLSRVYKRYRHGKCIRKLDRREYRYYHRK